MKKGKHKFFYGRLMMLIGLIMVVSGLSTLVNVVFGVGVGFVILAFMPSFYSEKLDEKETEAKK